MVSTANTTAISGSAAGAASILGTSQAAEQPAIKAIHTTQDLQKDLVSRLLDALPASTGQNRAVPGTPRASR